MAELRSYYDTPGVFNYTFHISLDPALVYVNNPKCGCSTAKASINSWYAAWHGQTLQYSSLKDVHSRFFNPLLTPNKLGKDAEHIILRAPEFFRCTLFREPMSRLTSAYQDKLGWNSKERQSFNNAANRPTDQPLSFSEFLSLMHENDALRELDEHWRPQTRQIAAPLINYDYICLTETLNQDLLAIRDLVFPGLDIGVFETTQFSIHNKSAGPRLLGVISNDQIALTRKIYADDFAFYGNILEARTKGLKAPPRSVIAV